MNKLYKINGTKVSIYMLTYSCTFPTKEAAEAFVEQSKKDDLLPHKPQGYGHIGKEAPK